MDELKPMLQNYIPRKALVCHCLDVSFVWHILDHRLTLQVIYGPLGDVLHKSHAPVSPSY